MAGMSSPGRPRLCQRPIQDLLDALARLGVAAASEHHNGCPPVIVQARGLAGGPTKVSGTISSQFLSAILLISPFAARDVEIEVVGELVSRPYVDITLNVMEDFGIAYYRQGYRYFAVPAGQRYQAQGLRGGRGCLQCLVFSGRRGSHRGPRHPDEPQSPILPGRYRLYQRFWNRWAAWWSHLRPE